MALTAFVDWVCAGALDQIDSLTVSSAKPVCARRSRAESGPALLGQKAHGKAVEAGKRRPAAVAALLRDGSIREVSTVRERAQACLYGTSVRYNRLGVQITTDQGANLLTGLAISTLKNPSEFTEHSDRYGNQRRIGQNPLGRSRLLQIVANHRANE